jgi:hypothetical protein
MLEGKGHMASYTSFGSRTSEEKLSDSHVSIQENMFPILMACFWSSS